jgi:hypothetical protein
MTETEVNVLNGRFKGIFQKTLKDKSAMSLVMANFITLLFTLIEGWSFQTLMWIYWSQNVIIGLFHFVKILSFKGAPAEGIKANKNPAKPVKTAKVGIAFFFLVHYGIFHLVYAIFLSIGFSFGHNKVKFVPEDDMVFVAISIFAFFANHLYSFVYNRKRDSLTKANFGRALFAPYIRIVPMHLTIIFGGVFLMALGPYSNLPITIIFLGLKTVADVIMHSSEHFGQLETAVKLSD